MSEWVVFGMASRRRLVCWASNTAWTQGYPRIHRLPKLERSGPMLQWMTDKYWYILPVLLAVLAGLIVLLVIVRKKQSEE